MNEQFTPRANPKSKRLNGIKVFTASKEISTWFDVDCVDIDRVNLEMAKAMRSRDSVFCSLRTNKYLMGWNVFEVAIHFKTGKVF